MTENSSDMSDTLKVFNENGGLVKYHLSRTSLVMPDGAEFSTVEKMIRGFKIVGDSVRFWLGDLLVYSERNYGEMYSQLVDSSDYAFNSLQDMMWVARSVAPMVRREELTWSHHREVAKLEIDKQREYLELAVKDSLTVSELKDAINKNEKTKKEQKTGKAYAFECALKNILKLSRDSGLVNEDLLNDRMSSKEELPSATISVTNIAMIAGDVLGIYA